MTRRSAIYAVLTMPLAKFDVWKAGQKAGKAVLTLDLDKWAGMDVKLGDDVVFVSARDIMDALKGVHQ